MPTKKQSNGASHWESCSMEPHGYSSRVVHSSLVLVTEGDVDGNMVHVGSSQRFLVSLGAAL